MKYPAKEGYVFYDSLGTIGQGDYWTHVKDGARSYFSKVELLHRPSIDTAASLYSMGMAELEKEKRMLAQYFGVTALEWNEQNYKQIIDALNQVLNIEAVYRRVVDRIKEGNKRLHLRDTNIASTYGSYVETQLNRSIPAFFTRKAVINYINNGDTNSLNRDFELMIKEALDKALDKMLSAKAEQKGDDRQIWLEALGAVNLIDDFRNKFGQEFFSRYGFDRLKTIVKEEVRNSIDVKGLKDKIVSTYKGEFKSKLGSQSIAGSVAEQVRQLLQTAAIDAMNGKSTTQSIGKTSMFTTDIVTIMDYNGIGDLTIDTTNVESKRDAQEAMSKFHQNVLSHLDDITVVYENTKKYNLGKNFKGFGGGTRRLDDIDLILSQIGYSHTEAFINKIKQTTEGAIYAGSGEQQAASETLAYAVAYFLFDDLDTIGVAASRGANVIHVFGLSDIVLPLSFLLIQMSKAMNDAINNIDAYVKVSFTLPPALYQYPQSDTSLIGSQTRWEAQKESMASQAQVNIDFLSNFKQLIKDFL